MKSLNSVPMDLLVVVTVLSATLPIRASAQTDFDVAAEGITRLAPTAFGELPQDAALTLELEGCTVPQAWGESGPHNVVAGSFATPGQRDWAVLCSREGSSAVVILWGGPVTCPSPIAPPLADRSFLQNTGLDGILFSRGIAGIRLDPRYWTIADGPPPPSFDHDAVSDAFYEKGATAYYCESGVWLQFTTGN